MIRALVQFIGSPLIHFSDGGFISWGWALVVAASWMLIPAVYLLRAAELRNRRRVHAMTQPAIDKGLADLRARAADAEARNPNGPEALFLRATLQSLTESQEAKNAA